MSAAPEYHVQPFAWIVKPKGATIYDETVTKIERDDEASGQFIKIIQCHDLIKPGTVLINPEEWPAIKRAVEAAFDEILKDELHEFAPDQSSK